MKKEKLLANKKKFVNLIFVVALFLFFIHGTVAQEKNKTIKVGYVWKQCSINKQIWPFSVNKW